MAEGKTVDPGSRIKLFSRLFTKKGGPVKRKKEAKKEKGVEIWKTLRVSHIPTPQTNNKLFIIYLYNYYLYSSS